MAKGSTMPNVNFPVQSENNPRHVRRDGFRIRWHEFAITQVGPSVSGKSCNTTDPGVDFSFNLDSALTQCRRVRHPCVRLSPLSLTCAHSRAMCSADMIKRFNRLLSPLVLSYLTHSVNHP
jgi:hypothetical protein